ncbi:proton-conducting transporter membrane subunit [soil metagenome]
MQLVLALCAIVAAPLAVTAGAVAARWSPHRAASAAATIVGLGGLAAVALAVVRPTAIARSGGDGIGWLPLRVDGLAELLLILVLGLSAVIQTFAVRYLRGDARQIWFVMTANALTTSTVVLACASTVWVFAFAWVAAGASLVALLATYRHLAEAKDGVRRTAIRFAIGDLFLLVAVAVLTISAGGDIGFARLGEVWAGLPSTTTVAIAILLVVPALARSSQIPFHGWLPTTLAAPTPVSALMHAGVVNAGAVLILRFSPVIGGSRLAMAVIFAAGTATLIYASVARMVKPDVKGRLVFSTMAQMGFMMLACGLGAYAAAVFHLVAHGLFKAALFLNAGSGVSREARQRAWPIRATPTRLRAATSAVIALAVAVGSILAAHTVLKVELSAPSQGLQIFLVFTAALLFATALTAHFSLATGLLASAGIVALSFGYSAVVAYFDAAVAVSISPATAAPSAWWLLVPGAALLALHAVPRLPAATGIPRRLYAASIAAGAPPRPAPLHRTNHLEEAS